MDICKIGMINTKEGEVRKREEPKEFVRDYAMEKDIISIAKGNYDHEKYPESLDAYKAYYRKHYGGMKEEVLTYRFFLQLFLKPAAEYVLKQTGDWERFVQVVMESDFVDFCLLQQKGNVSYEEKLFAKIESWLCTLQVRKSDENGKLKACSGWTEIFIYPGYKFKILDALITNFHLPESTLIMLVSALVGREHVLNAYQEAIRERYRFFSFGDAMFIK